MTIDSDDQLEGMLRAGAVAASALVEVAEHVRVGVTTKELDDIGRAVFHRFGARSAPRMFRDFPATLCISLNDEAVHGVPGLRALMPGDVVKIDATPFLDGFVADTAMTVVVGRDETKERLSECASRALQAGMGSAVPGRRTRDIGRAIEQVVRRAGFRVLREVGGHGVGRTMHEPPHVPNWNDSRARDVLHEGLVLAIEPIISVADEWLFEGPDSWALKTVGGSVAAHVEHTVIVASGSPMIVTAPERAIA